MGFISTAVSIFEHIILGAMVTMIFSPQSFTAIAVTDEVMINLKTGSFVSTTTVAVLVTITCVIFKVIITIDKVVERCSSNWFLHGR